MPEKNVRRRTSIGATRVTSTGAYRIISLSSVVFTGQISKKDGPFKAQKITKDGIIKKVSNTGFKVLMNEDTN